MEAFVYCTMIAGTIALIVAIEALLTNDVLGAFSPMIITAVSCFAAMAVAIIIDMRRGPK